MTRDAPELQLLGEIASGGMGYVELGRFRDEIGERLVAVKRMHPEYAKDPDFVHMFRDEIWLTGAVSHQSVVQLIGWGEDALGPYLIMEYVEGVAFGHAFEEGHFAGEPMPEELVAWVAARAGEGLFAAHTLRDTTSGRPLEIVHRDITPSNVLIGFDGSVKITDFGIAKATVRSSYTRTGILKGKIAYMSPEYAARRLGDAKSDLYSLGIVMFEALSGDVPFQARGDLELLKLVAYAAPPPLRSVAPGVDPELAAIVDRLLSKDPARRFSDGKTLAAELDAWGRSRGVDPNRTRAELAAYARRHGSGRREELRRLSDESAPSRRAAPERRLDTATFTLFEPRPAVVESERPGTRRLATSEAPPPFASVPKTRQVGMSDAPPAPILDSVPSMPKAPALPSFDAPSDSSPHSSDRASVPSVVPPAPPRVAEPADNHRALLVIASLVDSSGFGASIVLAMPSRAPTPSADPMPPPPPAVTVVPASTPVAAPVETLVPEAFPVETAEPVASEEAEPPRKPPRAGTKRRPPGIVTGTKRSLPCTPDRFDYPACLKH